MSETFGLELDQNCALLSEPESEEAQLQNLLLNMSGGLPYDHLDEDEKKLLDKYRGKDKT